MMTLPTFSDPNPTNEWLISEQARLHVQADKMMSTGIAVQLVPITGSITTEILPVYP